MQLSEAEAFGVLDDHMVASGTSTPTSTTVVATRISVSPRWNAPSPHPCQVPSSVRAQADGLAEHRA